MPHSSSATPQDLQLQIKDLQAEVLRLKTEAQKSSLGHEDIAKELLQRDLSLNKANQLLDAKILFQEAIVQSFSDGLLIFDEQGVVIDCNQTAIALLNCSKKDLLGLNTQNLDLEEINFKGFDRLKLLLEAPLADSEILRTKGLANTVQLIFKDLEKDQEQVILVTSVNITDRGRKLGKMKVLHDLTQAYFLDQVKSSFIDIAAHGLRTPLTSLKWSLELLPQETLSKSDKVELIEQSQSSVEKLLKIVNELLVASQLSSGKQQTVREEFDFVAVVKEVLAEVTSLDNNQSIKLTLDFQIDKLLMKLDKGLIKEVLTNLIKNAFYYTAGPPKDQEVKLLLESNQKEVSLKICNTGPLLDEQAQQKLFTRFFHANQDKNIVNERLGLGLYIAQQIVEVHQGELKYLGEAGFNCFKMSLPISKDN